MDRIFYSVETEETDEGKEIKVVHILGSIYDAEDDTEESYRIEECAFYYLYPDEIKELLEQDEFYEELGCAVRYCDECSEEKAEELAKTYFDGKSGQELYIGDVDEDTPCGEYWYDVEDYN